MLLAGQKSANKRAACLLLALLAVAGTGLIGQKPAPDLNAPGLRELVALEGFTILSTKAGYVASDDFIRFLEAGSTGIKEPDMFAGKGPLAILAIVFIGGLALNLTPCVLPMIPINLAIIGAGTQAASRRRGFMLGSAYGMGMAIAYGALGIIVTLTASTFGTVNSSPWFNLAIALLFIVLALAMFDVMSIDFSHLLSRVRVGTPGRGTFIMSFAMGAIAALLAGACVAPVVIQVVLFASSLYAKGTAIALALPFVLGLGMALPWPVAGAGLAALPRPGRWMVRIKQAFGVVILGAAGYYGYESYTLFRHQGTGAVAAAGIVEGNWHSSLVEGLEAAKREQKPVFIDMWATWCKSCGVMDATTFKDPAVKSALESFVKIKFQAEDPEAEPARSVMWKFDAIGLPTYVILKAR